MTQRRGKLHHVCISTCKNNYSNEQDYNVFNPGMCRGGVRAVCVLMHLRGSVAHFGESQAKKIIVLDNFFMESLF